MHWASISWVVIDNLISIPLFSVIYNHISKKPLVSITLIDLIYRDLIIYVYLHSLTLAVADIHCLIELENGTALDHFYSSLYAIISEVLVHCFSSSLILSGGLRFITLIKNSETQGLQLLGPENVAIIKIRVICILFSVVFEGILAFYLDVHSGIYNLMQNSETDFFLYDVYSDHFKSLFMVLPALALLVNLITKIYALWIKKKMSNTVNIFTIHNEGQQSTPVSNEELFSVPLEAAFGIPLWMMFAILSSIASREWRLTFFLPLQLMLINLLLPIYVISKNNKIRNSLLDPLQEQFNKALTSIKTQMASSVTPVERAVMYHSESISFTTVV